MKRFIIISLCFIFSVSLNDLKSQLVYSNGNVQVTKINENLFELKETLYFTANIIAITGSDSLLIMDTGFKQAASDLSDAVKHLNKGTAKCIINSHGHGDHVGANELFSKVTGEMSSGKSLEQLQNADVLKEWSEWGKFFSFITKETWIEQIYLSYQDQ
jgi:glyoxylase-like metal-dependent hydrolase (beta-lactamase superfamily II)